MECVCALALSPHPEDPEVTTAPKCLGEHMHNPPKAATRDRPISVPTYVAEVQIGNKTFILCNPGPTGTILARLGLVSLTGEVQSAHST